MQNSTRKLLLATAVVALLALAGCSGALTTSQTNTITDIQYQFDDGGPVIVANYTANDYATIILEDPRDNIISGEVSPDETQVVMPMGTPQPGEYTIALQQGGDTKSTETLSFDGPNPHIEDITPHWKNKTLDAVNVTIANTGDQPVRVSHTKYRARGQISEDTRNTWIPANTTKAITLPSMYGDTIRIDRGGTIHGGVTLQTSNGTLTQPFKTTLEPATVDLFDLNTEWEQGELQKLSFSTSNTGDLPTTFSTTITVNGDSVATREYTIAPGATNTYSITDEAHPVYPLYTASTDDVTITVMSDASNGASDSITTQHTFNINGEITDAGAFHNPISGDIEIVDFTLKNTGDAPLTYDDVSVTINGETSTESMLRASTLSPGESKPVNVQTDLSVSSGDHTATIRFHNEDNVVLTETVTISTND